MNEMMAIPLRPAIGLTCAVGFLAILVVALVKADRDKRRKLEAEGTEWCRAHTQLLPGLRLLLRNKLILVLSIITLVIMLGSLLAPLIWKTQ